MKFKQVKVVGLNSDQEAAVVASFGEDEQILVIVLSLVCDDAFGRGRQLMSDLADSFFSGEESASTKLSASLVEAKEKLADVESFSILLASIFGKVLYLVGQGSVRVILKRLENASTILEQGNGQLVSGYLQEGDRIFLATTNLVELLSKNITNHLELSLTEWEEAVRAKISGEDIEPEIDIPLATAGALIDILPDEEVAIPKTETIPPYQSTGFTSDKNAVFKSLADRLPTVRLAFPIGSRLKLSLAAIIILVVLVGGGLKFKASKDAQNSADFNHFFQVANDSYNEAQNLKTLNPAEAANKLSMAQDNIQKALKIDSKNQSAQDLSKNINSSSDEITQGAKANFNEYLALDLIKKGFSSQKMSLSAGQLLLLGFDDTLVTVNLDKKSHQIVAEKDKIGQARFSSINNNLAAVFSQDSALKLDLGNKSVAVVAKSDAKWQDIIDISIFGGNEYLLDNKANQIWKYLPTSTGFSDARSYLADGVKVDLSNSLRMRIDGSLYVLKSSGELLKFTKGSPDNFAYSGLSKNVKNPKSFFVSEDTNNLYLLDSGNSRLLVLAKNGQIVKEYQGDHFVSASDLVADEQAKKVYLLDNNKIYTMDLK